MLVLVVDDEESICELLALTLEDDYEVLKAYNGKEALELIKQHPVALILTDLMMPYMNGLELLEAVRTNPSFQDMPIILTSAADFPQDPVYQADAYLSKPFDLELLLQTVAGLITKKVSFENFEHSGLPTHLKLSFEDSARGEASSNSIINPPLQAIVDHPFVRRRNPSTNL